MSSSNAQYKAFLDAIHQGQQVWGLQSEEGWLVCASSDFENTEVMPFWSSKEGAERHCNEEWTAYEASAVPLAEFAGAWLAELDEEGILIGTDWDADLEGPEIEPSTVVRDLMEQ
ncbi:DUF2750 domain-containing protein [Gallaecimonas sp. GXIMD4217]|uniref:DUF2750 domain-containing protein n=1 Tax=Gallaecimonas sp. GXIMD4217 TaxID=3131927 RepID=UPI00311B0E1B